MQEETSINEAASAVEPADLVTKPATKSRSKKVAASGRGWFPRPVIAAAMFVVIVTLAWGAWSVVQKPSIPADEEELAEFENLDDPDQTKSTAKANELEDATDDSTSGGVTTALANSHSNPTARFGDVTVPPLALPPATDSSETPSLGVPSGSTFPSMARTNTPGQISLPNFAPLSRANEDSMGNEMVFSTKSGAIPGATESGAWLDGTIETDTAMSSSPRTNSSRLPVRPSSASKRPITFPR